MARHVNSMPSLSASEVTGRHMSQRSSTAWGVPSVLLEAHRRMCCLRDTTHNEGQQFLLRLFKKVAK